MSTTNIKLKRSSVPGKQPNTSILELGEVALNTYDGKIFIKKDDGAESIVTIQEVTEDNLIIDSSLLDNATANTLAGVLDDLDDAITNLSGGGITEVTSDSTLTGLGTANSSLSVVDDGHNHTVSTITDFTTSVNSAIDTRVNKTFVDALNVDADTLDGANGSFYLDYSNFTNTPSIPVSGVDFDPVGTDNSTDVTLAGSYDYLTITGQQITLNQIDYTTDISNTPTIGDGSITFSGDSIIGVSGSFSLNDTANSQITLSVNAAAISITESQISDFDTYLPTADFTATANTWLATRSTSNLSEGTNLYYTTARANTDIDARVTKSFVDALNVDADTLDGQDGSYYLDYNNFTNTPTDSDTTYDLTIPATGTIRLSDSANSNDDVVFVGSGATSVSSNTTHIIISSTDNNTTYSAGNGIDLSGTTFSVAAGSGLTQDATGLSHSDTSTQASLTALTGANVVSDIDLDGFGHVTSLATRAMTLADLGYTGETDATADQTITAGTGLSGGGTGDVTINHSNSITAGTVSEGGSTRTLAYGGSFNVPSVTYDAQGHITGTATVALTLPASDNTDTTYSAGDGLTLTSTTFSVDVSGDSSLIANTSGLFIDDSTLSIATSQLTGDVALGTQTSGNYVATISGTANEIEVSGSGSETASVTIGLPNDVTIGNNLVVSGNLTVSGTTTTVNTETINLADNIITLNSNAPATPTENAGIEVERGTSENALLQWNETSDHWEIAFGGTTGRILTTGDEGTGNGLDADTLDGQQGTHYLDYNNFTNTPTIPTVNDGTITISAGSGLTTGGAFTTNQSANETITINHADTSTQASLTALTGANVVSDIDLDGFGHVTSLATRAMTLADLGYTGDTNADNYVKWNLYTDNTFRNGITKDQNVNFLGGTNVTLSYSSTNNTVTVNATDTNTTYSAGNGISLSGTTFSVAAGSGLTQDASGLSHADTSTQASVNNSGTTVIQDVTLDGFGHVTGLASTTIPTYTNSDVDTHLNTGTATTDQILSWTGTDYDWIDNTAGITITDDTSTNATRYLTFTSATSGSISAENVSSTKLYFNPSTGDLSATNFNTLSDATFKENLTPIKNSIDVINKISTYGFQWKDNKEKSYGVIAQEIEKVLPELVKENDEGVKSVAYIPLIAILIDAVKELDKKLKG